MTNERISNYEVTFLKGCEKAGDLKKWFAENPEAIGIAMVGRSNVGKSSLINRLTRRKTAKVSNTPGRTREINIFRFEMDNQSLVDQKTIDPSVNQTRLPTTSFYLFDLPGYGHADVSKAMGKNWGQLMDAFFNSLDHKILIINVQDARHPYQDNDAQFLHYLAASCSNEILLALNKIDKLKTQKERAALQKEIHQFLPEIKQVKYIHQISAETGQGIAELVQTITNFLWKIYDTKSF